VVICPDAPAPKAPAGLPNPAACFGFANPKRAWAGGNERCRAGVREKLLQKM